MTCRLPQRRIPNFRYAKPATNQTLRLFSSGHLAIITIAVASGLIADSAPVVTLVQDNFIRNFSPHTHTHIVDDSDITD